MSAVFALVSVGAMVVSICMYAKTRRLAREIARGSRTVSSAPPDPLP